MLNWREICTALLECKQTFTIFFVFCDLKRFSWLSTEQKLKLSKLLREAARWQLLSVLSWLLRNNKQRHLGSLIAVLDLDDLDWKGQKSLKWLKIILNRTKFCHKSSSNGRDIAIALLDVEQTFTSFFVFPKDDFLWAFRAFLSYILITLLEFTKRKV